MDIYRGLDEHKDYLVPYYEALIAIGEHDVVWAEQKIEEIKTSYPENEEAMFVIGDYYASQCRYEEAIEYYEKCYELDEKPRYYDPLQGRHLRVHACRRQAERFFRYLQRIPGLRSLYRERQ